MQTVKAMQTESVRRRQQINICCKGSHLKSSKTAKWILVRNSWGSMFVMGEGYVSATGSKKESLCEGHKMGSWVKDE